MLDESPRGDLERKGGGIKRRKTNAEGYTILELPIKDLTYAKSAACEQLLQEEATRLSPGLWKDVVRALLL